ncbi:MAG: hypothetical protein WCZ89_10400 [Phycisphaerae bacterium]
MVKHRLNKYLKWWPLLIGPTSMILVYIAFYFDKLRFVDKAANENIALILLGIAAANFALQTAIYKKSFILFMLCLTAAFFCREWHFPGTGKGIYIALACLVFWAFKQKNEFEKYIGPSRFRIWLIATFAAYLFSQLIARRVFRYIYLPYEDPLHIYLEETAETAAHLMMLAASFALWPIAAKNSKSNSQS